MGSTRVNVVVFTPISDMSPEKSRMANLATRAVTTAYFDIDNRATIEFYSNLDEVAATVDSYYTSAVIAVITDLSSCDRSDVERLIEGCSTNNMLVLVSVARDYDKAWARRLGNPDRVDVIPMTDLSKPAVTMAKVGPFLARTAN